jgi:surface polysaccharide O-acyltransferase-like enzyme
MLSGALLLDPNRRENSIEFYKKRLHRIGLPILFWSIFYLIWRSVVLHEATLRPKVLLSNIVFGSPSYHLWFLFVLFWLYLVTPILRSIWRKLDNKEKWTLTIFLLSVNSISTLLWAYAGEMGWRIPPSPVITIEWIYYVGYFLLGFLMRGITIDKTKAFALAGIWLVIVIANSIGYYALSTLEEEYRAQGLVHSYLSPLVVISSIAMFLLIKSIFSKKQNTLSRALNSSILGSASFGVYLIHIAVLDTLMVVMKWNKLVGTDIWSFFLLLVTVPVISFILIIGLRQISVFRKILG